jgi:hypothetical protein
MVLLSAGRQGGDGCGRKKKHRAEIRATNTLCSEEMNRMKRSSSRNGIFWYGGSGGSSARQPTPLSSRDLLPRRRTGTTTAILSSGHKKSRSSAGETTGTWESLALLVPVSFFFRVRQRRRWATATPPQAAARCRHIKSAIRML